MVGNIAGDDLVERDGGTAIAPLHRQIHLRRVGSEIRPLTPHLNLVGREVASHAGDAITEATGPDTHQPT